MENACTENEIKVERAVCFWFFFKANSSLLNVFFWSLPGFLLFFYNANVSGFWHIQFLALWSLKAFSSYSKT